MPWQALEDAPVDAERYYPPCMCMDRSGFFLFVLSSEFVLVKMGTGRGDSVAGKVYLQDTRMSVYAGHTIAITHTSASLTTNDQVWLQNSKTAWR